MKVRDIMCRDVVTLRLDDALDIAADIMNLGRIRHLPVVDRAERLVGIVTHRDLLRASISSVLGLGPKRDREWLGKVPVREVMTSAVVTVTADDSLAEAAERMIRGKFGCVPVVDPAGRLVGLVTETDCLRVLRDLLERRQ